MVDLKVGLILHEISKRQTKRMEAKNRILFEGEQLEHVRISQPASKLSPSRTSPLGFRMVTLGYPFHMSPMIGWTRNDRVFQPTTRHYSHLRWLDLGLLVGSG